MSQVNSSRFTVLSMNVHKGLSPLHRHATIYQLRQQMRTHYPDLLFLQELQQEHRGRVRRFDQWPLTELTHFLSEDFWHHWHYGKNVEYRDGHHGNAILSRHPQQKGNNYDISAYRFEGRGLLHSITRLEGIDKPIHCFCVHLALFERGRQLGQGRDSKFLTDDPYWNLRGNLGAIFGSARLVLVAHCNCFSGVDDCLADWFAGCSS